MNQDQWLDFHDATCTAARRLTEAKGHDYAAGHDPFRNLRLSQHLGIASTPTGTLCRLLDKVARICNLHVHGAMVQETQADTILDLINYSIMYLALISGPSVLHTAEATTDSPE